MIMKVFNKGQVVIPAKMRRALGIDIGDMLDIRIDEERGAIELRKKETFDAKTLAGSLSAYSKGKKMPSRKAMDGALRKGLSGEA